jgi:hypothetical protein
MMTANEELGWKDVDGSCHDQFEGVFLACIQRD